MSPLSEFIMNKKDKDIDAIKAMCGCFKVDFNFRETAYHGSDPSYRPSPDKHEQATEWIELIEETEDRLVLQHLLIIGGANPNMIIKHWRQDWLYENRHLHDYHSGKHWIYRDLSHEEVKGQWTQKVYQVDDSPRYCGSAVWIHDDGKSIWQSTSPAPLPRRETGREDYDALIRTNTHVITDEGWVHEQYNKKIKRNQQGEDILIAEESGINYYLRLENSNCVAAEQWWNENRQLWTLVRNTWNEIMSLPGDIHLVDKVEGLTLSEHITNAGLSATDDDIRRIIKSFLISST